MNKLRMFVTDNEGERIEVTNKMYWFEEQMCDLNDCDVEIFFYDKQIYPIVESE